MNPHAGTGPLELILPGRLFGPFLKQQPSLFRFTGERSRCRHRAPGGLGNDYEGYEYACGGG